MWKCPVCGKENETLQCGCGFDGSRDYEVLPTFGELGGNALPSRGTRRKQLQFRQKRLLRCCSCGGSGFAFDLEQMVLRCLQCGQEMAWDKNPGIPRPKTKPAVSVKKPVSTPKQMPPPNRPQNTGFANAKEMLMALGLPELANDISETNSGKDKAQKAAQVQQGGKTANAGFSSAREMLEALGIQLDDAEN